MAQYLLLEFDNDEQCAALIEKLKTKTTIHLRGLFQKPRTHCKCGPLSDTEQRGRIKRGQKFGWWVDTICGRAHGSYQTPRNLLYPDGTHPRDVNDYLHLNREEPVRKFPVSVRTK